MLPRLHLRSAPLPEAVIQPPASRRPLLLGLSLGLGLALVLYVNTLSLPVFQDDFRHIRWLARHDSPFAPFITADGTPAYRPLGKMLLKGWYLLLGRHDAVWLRFLNIAMHCLNIALVGALAFRLDAGRGRYRTAGLAAVLFATFPFAYQAIPWINVFFYPLNNLLQLSMLLLYWEGRQRRSTLLLALSLFLGLASAFEIEYGLVNGGLLLALEICLWLQGRQRGIWLAGPLASLVLSLGFLAAWLLVPKTAYQFGPPTAERMMQIAVYLLQGLTYPVAPLAQTLESAFGVNDLLAIAVVGLPAALVAVVVLYRRGQRALLVFSLLVFGLLNLPTLFTLNFAYVINSPRLLYPSGPALTWIWGALLLAGTSDWTRSRLHTALSRLAALAIVALGLNFVRIRTDLYHVIEHPVHQIGQIARETTPGRPMLFVNLPSWIESADRTFVLGNNGVQFIPFYISIDDVIFSLNDVDNPSRALLFENVLKPQEYFFGLFGQPVGWEELRHELEDGGDVYLTRYGSERIELLKAGRVSDVAWDMASAGATGASFDGLLEVMAVAGGVEDDELRLVLNWRLKGKVPDGLTVFVHLYGPDGRLVVQDDGYPLRGLAPFWLWDAGSVLEDHRLLTWAPDLEPGAYEVAVGVYDSVTGQRVPAVDLEGTSLKDDAAVLFRVDKR